MAWFVVAAQNCVAMIKKIRSLFRRKNRAKAPNSQTISPVPACRIADPAAPIFPVGTNVLHSRFGQGKVVEISVRGNDTVVQVHFNTDGVKYLALEYANLQLDEAANEHHPVILGESGNHNVQSGPQKPFEFTAVEDLQRIAAESASEVVAFAQQNFGERLDFSDASIKTVEKMLESAHAAYLGGQMKAEDVTKQAQFIGSYIGETYRRNHGGVWGLVISGTEKTIGFQCGSNDKSGGLFWPMVRVEKRIVGGSEENVLHYYHFLVKAHGLSR